MPPVVRLLQAPGSWLELVEEGKEARISPSLKALMVPEFIRPRNPGK